MLKGALDMMVLRTLEPGDAHGHTIAQVIERTSEDVLSSYWGASENNRKARFHRLTAAGKRQLGRETNRWRRMARAIGLVMGENVRARALRS